MASSSSIDLSFLRSRAALKRIALVSGAFALAALLYGFLAPRWYRSVLTVMPAKAQKAGLSSLLGGDLAALAAGFEATSGGSADVARIAAVLQSIAVTDAVIEKFDLRTRYGMKYVETTRDALWRHCDVKTLAKPSLVQLSCEDRDPAFAKQMVTFFSEFGNAVFRRVGAGSASEEVRFLEKRVAELRTQADESAARMRAFQEEHRIIDLDTQSKAVVSALAALNAQRISRQLELDYTRSFSSGEEATSQQLAAELRAIDRKLLDLESVGPAPAGVEGSPRKAPGRSQGLFPTALSVPRLRAEFETLYRERKVAEATLVFALERLEGARANEARDVSTFLVLDPPTLPTKSSRPKRALLLVVFTALGLGGALTWEWWTVAKRSALARRSAT